MLGKLFGLSDGETIHTIVWARLQMWLAALWAVLQMTPLDPLLNAIGLGRWTPLALFGMGVVTELVRRYKAEDV